MGELSIPDMLPSAAISPSSQRCRMAVKTEARVPAPLPSSSSPSSSSSSCPSPSPSSSMGGNEQFPAGMRVLLVDDDRTCLKILSQMLCRCNYQVTPCSKATDALALLRANWGGYDMVISDVYMPDMDGFKLLELVGLEMDLPVIMMSANGDTSVVMKGITHGACDYLLKPVRMEELRNIWQHVIRRRSSANEEKHKHRSGDGHRSPSCEGPDATGSSYRHSKKRKEGMMMAEEDEEDEEHEGEELAGGAKKARVVWSVDLHQQFVNAVNQLGIDKAVPKRILELMNVPGLTRENVASHLQKYRLYLKRISGVSSEAGGGGTNNPPLPPSSTLGDLQALAAAVQLSPQALSSTLIHQLSLPNALGGALTTDPALLLHHLALMQASGSNSSTTTSALPRTLFGQSSGRLPELNSTNNALPMQFLQQSHRLPSIGLHVSTNEVGVSGLSQLKSNPLSSSLLSSNPTLPYEVGSNGLPLPLLKPNPPPPNLLSSNPTLSYEVGSNGLPRLKSNLLGLNPTSLPFEVGSNGLTQLKPNQSPSNHLGLNPTSLSYELGSNELPQLKSNPPPSNLLSSNPTLPYEVGSNGLPLLKPNPSPSNLLSSNPSLSYEVGSSDLPHLKINSSLTNLIGSNPTLPYEVGSNNLPQLKRNSSLTNLIGSNPTLPYEAGSNDLPQLKRNSSLTNLLGSNLTLPYDVGSNGFSQLKPNPPLSNLLRLNSTLPYEVGSNGLPELKPDPSPNLLGSNPTSLPYASLASSEDESEGGFNPIYSSNMAINGMTKLSQYTSSNPNPLNHPGWQTLGLHHNMRQSAITTSPLASPRCHDMGSFGSSVNNDQMQAWATTPFASHNGSSSSNTSTSSTQLKPSFGHIPKQYKQPSIVEAGNESKIEEGSPHLLVGSRTSHGMMSETFSTSEELMMHMLLKQRQDGFSESDFVGGNIGLNNMYVK